MEDEQIKKLKDFEKKLIKEFFLFRQKVEQERTKTKEILEKEIRKIDINKLKNLEPVQLKEEEEETVKLTERNSVVIPFTFFGENHTLLLYRKDYKYYEDEEEIETDEKQTDKGYEYRKIKYEIWKKISYYVYKVKVDLEKDELESKYDPEHDYEGKILLCNGSKYHNQINSEDFKIDIEELKDNEDIVMEIIPNIVLSIEDKFERFFLTIGLKDVYLYKDIYIDESFYTTGFLDDIKMGFCFGYPSKDEINNSFVNYLIIYSEGMSSGGYQEIKDIKQDLDIPIVMYEEKGLENFDKDIRLIEEIQKEIKIKKINIGIQSVLDILVPSGIKGSHSSVIEGLSMLGVRNNFKVQKEVNPNQESDEMGKRVDLVWYDPKSEEPLVAIEVTHSSEATYDLSKMVQLNAKICVIYTKENKVIPFTNYFKENTVISERFKPDLIIISPKQYSIFEKGVLKKIERI